MKFLVSKLKQLSERENIWSQKQLCPMIATPTWNGCNSLTPCCALCVTMISPQIHRMCNLPLLLHSPHCAPQYVRTHEQVDLGVALLLCCLCHCIATALHSNLARPARIFPICNNLTIRHMSACFLMSCQFQCGEFYIVSGWAMAEYLSSPS